MGCNTHRTLRTIAGGAVASHSSGYVNHLLEAMLFQNACAEARSMSGAAHKGGWNIRIQLLVSGPQIGGRDIEGSLDMKSLVFPWRPDINDRQLPFPGTHLMEFFSG